MPNLIQKVAAQSEPTFPYDGPFEEPSPPPTQGQATINLSTSSSSLQVGQSATCDLEIESDQEEIDSYSITIVFNASVLEVVDADSSQSGIQIDFLDTFSTEQGNTADNTAGTIQLEAQISGAAQPINRRIAQVTFRAKRTGTSIVSINKSQSSVLNDAGSDILGSTASLNFTITGETQTNGELPESGIADTLANAGTVLTALLMLYIGIKIVIDKRKGKEIDI